MVATRAERGVRRGSLMARVQQSPHSRGHGRLDRGRVQRHRIRVWIARRDEQNLVGTGEGAGQRVRIGIVAAPDLHATIGEPGSLRRVAHDDRDVAGRRAAQQVIDRGAVQRTGCSRNDDHRRPSS